VKFGPPQPLDANHDTAQFSNGRHQVLDDWLRQAFERGEGRTARSFVCCEAGTRRVLGYYALASGSVRRTSLPTAKLRRGLVDPVPVVLLARLAVDQTAQGQGLGGALVRDAFAKILAATETVAAFAVLVHALDDEAAAFYRKFGFLDSGIETRTLVLPIGLLRAGA